MKKSKKLGLQSLALILMSFVLVAGVAFGMTGAWFTDTKDAEQAVITMGNVVDIDAVSLSFTGTAYDQYGNAYASGTKYYFPGQKLIAAGNITMAAESANAYLRVTVTTVVAAELQDVVDLSGLKIGGQAVTGADDEVVIYLEYTHGDEAFEVSGEIELDGETLKNAVAGKDIKIDVKVEALQSANTTNGADGTWADLGSYVFEVVAD